MKKLIIVVIVSIIALCVSYQANAADYTINVPQYSEQYISGRSHDTKILLKTICINGYKFLVTYIPVGSSDASPQLSVIQMYKASESSYKNESPMKCAD